MKKLPDFNNEKDEAGFWEKHTIADYWKDLEERDDTFKKPKLKPVTLKFDPLILKLNSWLERGVFHTMHTYGICLPKALKMKCLSATSINLNS